ncbi:hypothetical protein AWH56_022230 [Anaerobacillus isosaccharinicus]|uniref:Uncharacterized protein n=1 Tax=Anaerobacillus isosaccharinicus TaxID=1532552 RepID=A0A7S7RAZ6_9BACI|nr:hypothetical protein [Anaerobacillus isosaccharinicus]
MQTFQQQTTVSIPFPTRWGILGDIAGRPLIRGFLTIDSITNGNLTGTVNFRGVPLPITGIWNESTNQITFDSPYATFSGQLSIFDETVISLRRFILTGNFLMKPPSLQAGEFGTWVALTDTIRTGPPQYTSTVPTAALFILSDLLYGTSQTFR